MIKKISVLLLVICMMVPVFAGCSSEKDKETENTTPTGTLSAMDEYLASLPDRDFGGEDFSILCTTQTEFFFNVNEMGSEVVGKSVYTRNQEVKDKYNINLVFKSLDGNIAGQGDFANEIRNTTAAGEGHDLIIAQNYYTLPLATEGCLMDLNNSEYLHWDKEWYHNKINQHTEINGKRYAGSGDLVMSQISNAMGIFYNKDVYAEQGYTEDLYALVKNKQWTIEKLLTLTKDFHIDATENGKSDDDTFGFFANMHGATSMLLGMECKIISYDGNGKPSLDNYYNERLLAAADKLHALIQTNEGGSWKNEDELGVQKVADGTAMFASSRIGYFVESADLRNSQHNIGILPNPLYDTTQTEYYTSTMRWELFYIPSNADLETSAIILEYLNFNSFEYVIPAYWETAMTIRGANTVEDSEMFNLIRDNLYFDFANVFKGSLKGISDAVGNLVHSSTGKLRLAAWWGSNSSTYKKALDATLTAFG